MLSFSQYQTEQGFIVTLYISVVTFNNSDTARIVIGCRDSCIFLLTFHHFKLNLSGTFRRKKTKKIRKSFVIKQYYTARNEKLVGRWQFIEAYIFYRSFFVHILCLRVWYRCFSIVVKYLKEATIFYLGFVEKPIPIVTRIAILCIIKRAGRSKVAHVFVINTKFCG